MDKVIMESNLNTNEYAKWLQDLKAKIRSVQVKAALSANSILIDFYFDLGRSISEKDAVWGSKLVPKLSKDLKNTFPDMQGFSVTNLKYCRLFYECIKNQSMGNPDDVSIGPQAGDQLKRQSIDQPYMLIRQLPWGHVKILTSKVKCVKESLFYIQQTIENGWSREVLALQIKSKLYSRQGKSTSNFSQTLPKPQSDLAQQTIKDPYTFDFLTMTQPYNERDIERQLVEHITKPGSAEPQLRTHPELQNSKEWYSRGYLPHYDRIGLLQSITFRLADSLPQEKLRQLEAEREVLRKNAELGLRVPENAELGLRVPENAELGLRGPSVSVDVEQRKKIETWLDAGMGCCALNHPQMANVMQETLLKFDGEKYRLLAWCIMPNHVHVLIDPQVEIKKIVQSWKSYTGRWALAYNAELGLRVPGKAFWMADYWDRFIRNEKHLLSVVEYIHQNPVKAKLRLTPEEWPWSSARFMELEIVKQYMEA